MKKLLLILPVVALSLSACQQTNSNQNAALGALGGAAVGAAVSHGNRTKGALIGAAVGVAASTLIGPAQTPGQCYYRDQYGQRFIANC